MTLCAFKNSRWVPCGIITQYINIRGTHTSDKRMAYGLDTLPRPVAHTFYQLCRLISEAEYHSCSVEGSYANENSRHNTACYLSNIAARGLITHVGSRSRECQCSVGCLDGELLMLERSVFSFQRCYLYVLSDGRINTRSRTNFA